MSKQDGDAGERTVREKARQTGESVKRRLGQTVERFSPEATDRIWTLPNLLSMLRIVSVPVIAWLVMTDHLLAALVTLALSSASDGIDGYIARRYNQVTKLGQILDPVADRLLIAFSMLALAYVHILPWWVLAVVLSREVVMALLILCLAQHDYGPLPVHFVGKAGTAVLMITVPIFLISQMGDGPVLTILHYMGDACAIWGCTLYWTAGIIYLVQGTTLIREDTRAAADHVLA